MDGAEDVLPRVLWHLFAFLGAWLVLGRVAAAAEALAARDGRSSG